MGYYVGFCSDLYKLNLLRCFNVDYYCICVYYVVIFECWVFEVKIILFYFWGNEIKIIKNFLKYGGILWLWVIKLVKKVKFKNLVFMIWK